VRETSVFNSIKYSGAQALRDSGLIRIRKVLDLIGEGRTVLDVGCWDGSIGELIKRNNNDVYGLENSLNAIRLAEDKGIKVKEFNLEEEVWPDFGIKFDVVFAGEIIEHIFDTDKFLQNIRAVLKDDGYAVLTTPNIAALGRRLMLLLGLNPLIETTAREHDGGHIRYFTRDTLIRLLDDNGFATVKFQSDVINFTNSGQFYTRLIPMILPTLGRSLIVKAVKKSCKGGVVE